MDYKKIYLILGIFLVVCVISGVTFGFYKWESLENQNTEIIFTEEEPFRCSVDGGGNITENDIELVPTTVDKNENIIKREIKIDTVMDNNGFYVSLDLWLDINDLGSGLSESENFRWMLSTSSTANEVDTAGDGVVSYGTFNGLITNDKVHLIDDKIYNSSTVDDTYYLYIWLDSKQKSNITMNQRFSLSLNGSCTNVSKGDPFYAVYSADDTSLRFYKEQEGVIVEGQPYEGRIATNVFKAYENDVYKTNLDVPWSTVKDTTTQIMVVDEIKPYSLKYWFFGFRNVSNIDVTNLNTENVVSVKGMFYQLGYNVTDTFTITGLNNWNTINVKDMYGLFVQTGRNATTFNIGDLSNWNTSNVIDMLGVFFETGRATENFNIGDLSNWDVSSVVTVRTMFQDAGYNSRIFNIGDLSNWDVSNVLSIDYMFCQTGYNATNWNIGNLSNWDVSNVLNMKSMFYYAGINATNWNIGNLSNWDVSNVTDMQHMFNSAGYNATTFDIGNLDNWDVSNVTNMYAMFANAGQNATNWNIGNLSNWDVSNVTNMSYMFNYAGYNATAFNIGNLSNWNTSNVENMSYMFRKTGLNANWSLDLSNWNVDKVISYTYFNKDAETKIIAPIWVNEDQGDLS